MSNTKTKILDLAEAFTQEKGFNGFSYLDIADEIGIKAASVHYHYKNKDDLAAGIVERTHEHHMKVFKNMLVTIDDPKVRLEAVTDHFKAYAAQNKFCLCGMLAAELYSVSERVCKLLDKYFRDFEIWLAQQFEEMGHKDSSIRALHFLSALEGSLLLARLRQDPTLIEQTLAGLS